MAGLVTLGLFILLSPYGSFADRKFTINNNCNTTIWPAVYTEQAISGGTAIPSNETGWEAPAESSMSITIPDSWTGRIWARQGCDFSSGNGSCATGDCGSGLLCSGTSAGPLTLTEWALGINDDSSSDYYDISIVDGFNLAVELKANTACPTIACKTNFNTACPSELQGPTANGTLLACKSACGAQIGDSDQQSSNCCTGSHNTADSCPTSGIQYYDFYHDACPQAYVSPYDSDNMTLVASNSCPGPELADYTVTFCPYGEVAWTAPNSTSSASPTASSNSSSSSANTSNDETLSGGAIAGIVIGSVAAALIAVALAFFVRRHNHQNPKEPKLEVVKENLTQVTPFVEQPLSDMVAPTTSMSNVSPVSGQNATAAAYAGYFERKKGAGASQARDRPFSLSEGSSSPSSTPLLGPIPTFTQSGSSSIPAPPLSPPPPPDSPPRDPVDIERLFEDRQFENQLLSFLQQRMDRPGVDVDDEAPPRYPDGH